MRFMSTLVRSCLTMLVTVFCLVCLCQFAGMAMWWYAPPFGNRVVPGQANMRAGNPNLGPYEHWAWEMENSDRDEPRPVPQIHFVEQDPNRSSPFARVLELAEPPQPKR